MPTKNDQLRAARRRTESLTQPDECLSRQELAELANWRPLGPSGPAAPLMTCGSWLVAPASTTTSRRSPSCGAASPPWFWRCEHLSGGAARRV